LHGERQKDRNSSDTVLDRKTNRQTRGKKKALDRKTNRQKRGKKKALLLGSERGKFPSVILT